MSAPETLFTAEEIQQRVRLMARTIARAPLLPDIAMPVLVGGFVFAADLLPTTAHVDVPWIMAYDLYPMETLEFKRAFVAEAVEREYLIFFEHDPEIAAGYLRRKDKRLYVEPAL